MLKGERSLCSTGTADQSLEIDCLNNGEDGQWKPNVIIHHISCIHIGTSASGVVSKHRSERTLASELSSRCRHRSITLDFTWEI